jgi:hypothetical protein
LDVFIQLNPTCDPFAFNAIKGKDEGESETYKTDSNAIYWRANVYEVEEFAFEPVTKEIS